MWAKVLGYIHNTVDWGVRGSWYKECRCFQALRVNGPKKTKKGWNECRNVSGVTSDRRVWEHRWLAGLETVALRERGGRDGGQHAFKCWASLVQQLGCTRSEMSSNHDFGFIVTVRSTNIKKKSHTHTILNFHIPHFHTEYVFFLYVGPNANVQIKSSLLPCTTVWRGFRVHQRERETA